jgi:hypothetical protein
MPVPCKGWASPGPGDVEHPAADGLILAAGNQLGLGPVRAEGLARSAEPGSQDAALSHDDVRAGGCRLPGTDDNPAPGRSAWFWLA